MTHKSHDSNVLCSPACINIRLNTCHFGKCLPRTATYHARKRSTFRTQRHRCTVSAELSWVVLNTSYCRLPQFPHERIEINGALTSMRTARTLDPGGNFEYLVMILHSCLRWFQLFSIQCSHVPMFSVGALPNGGRPETKNA